MTATPTFLAIVLLAALPDSSTAAKLCVPPTGDSSGYSYIRGEIKALEWVGLALSEAKKVQAPGAPSDPASFHRLVELHATGESVQDDYRCAEMILSKFKDSKNPHIAESASTFLMAIGTAKDIASKMVEMTDMLYNAKQPTDIDQVGIAKMLGNIRAMQGDIQNLVMLATKMGTFSIMRMAGDGDDAKPTGFAITPAERSTLLAEATALAKKKGAEYNYVDASADLLVSTLQANFGKSSGNR